MIFPCHVCRTQLSADDSQAGQLVRCPNCMTALRVPARNPQAMAVATATPAGRAATITTSHLGLGQAAIRGTGKRYGFNCGYCSSRLEANEAMAGQDGQCPTCGKSITIPILDRYGRLIDPRTREIVKQDPHPVHAYAAAGDRAPTIVRLKDGAQVIQCPRCATSNPITSNNCRNCGMPFTMEGTTLEAAGTSNGFCVASLVLGIIGIPAACTFITPVLAIIFGIIGYTQVSRTDAEGGGKGMAIAGIICGTIGTFLAMMFLFNA